MINNTKSVLHYHLKVDELKKHLRLDDDFEDDNFYLEKCIKASYGYCENYCEKAIAYTYNTYTILTDGLTSYSSFDIDEGNFISLSGTPSYTGTTTASLASGDYLIYKYYDRFVIDLDNSISASAVTINFFSGYAADEIPPVLEQALMIQAANYYDVVRTDWVSGSFKNEQVVNGILNHYKAMRF